MMGVLSGVSAEWEPEDGAVLPAVVPPGVGVCTDPVCHLSATACLLGLPHPVAGGLHLPHLIFCSACQPHLSQHPAVDHHAQKQPQDTQNGTSNNSTPLN